MFSLLFIAVYCISLIFFDVQYHFQIVVAIGNSSTQRNTSSRLKTLPNRSQVHVLARGSMCIAFKSAARG